MTTRPSRATRPAHSGLNLRKSAVLRHWQSRSPRMSRVVHLMDTMEDWVMDEKKEIEQSLHRMGNRVEKASPNQLLKKSEPLLRLMAYMSSSRTMMMMNWMDEQFQGKVGFRLLDLAQQTQDDPTSRLMLERIRTLHSMSMLPEIFSPMRMRFVLSLLEDTEENDDGGRGRDGRRGGGRV
jgi:hypothetical protein